MNRRISLGFFRISPVSKTSRVAPTAASSSRSSNTSLGARLPFVPCLYNGNVTPQLAAKYQPCLDGILFPYRHEAGKRNLSEWVTLEAEVARVKARIGGDLPVVLDMYATRRSQLNDSSADYVRQVMTIGRRYADGVIIYQHQYEASSPEKYHVIKELFDLWASEKKGQTPALNR
jgi:hypothetical protein